MESSKERPMVRKHLLSTIGLLGLCFPPGCAQDRTSSIQRAEEFVPNPLCTIGADWDPDVDDPSDAALVLIKNGAADVIGTGRASEVSFIKTSWPGQGRVLSDNIFVAGLAPFMHLNNPDGVCYLTNYVERAKNSGLLAQAIARSNS